VKHRAGKVVKAVSTQVNIKAAYLFGSQLNGGRDEWSDTDIGLFISGYNDLEYENEFQLTHFIHRLLGFDIDLHFFDAEYLTNSTPTSFAGWVVRNGVRVS